MAVARDHVPVDEDAPMVGPFEASDQAERGGLAATAGAEESQDLAVVKREADPVDSGRAGAKGLAHFLKLNASHLAPPL